jgi:hypothetical protein
LWRRAGAEAGAGADVGGAGERSGATGRAATREGERERNGEEAGGTEREREREGEREGEDGRERGRGRGREREREGEGDGERERERERERGLERMRVSETEKRVHTARQLMGRRGHKSTEARAPRSAGASSGSASDLRRSAAGVLRRASCGGEAEGGPCTSAAAQNPGMQIYSMARAAQRPYNGRLRQQPNLARASSGIQARVAFALGRALCKNLGPPSTFEITFGL